MSLPLVTLPHLATPSLAMSLLSDLLPRLSHSNPSIRKKTVATLYRLALVHPDTLRSAWPKIKDILMDEEEGSSVTAAVVNVVCELGWRRPRDFLSLAPRLFDLLVEGGNNWMAIKIIKLFAILTPLEPRLIKKLLPPLTNLIKTTPAMSLLYECINGVIQGGVLDGTDGVREGEEIALLCVQKLRGMIVIEGDPNLKYVALLAFKRILISHSHLVSTQQDVIMTCIDDQDVSIRLQALELGAGMVNGDNITILVERLIQQLRTAPASNLGADDQGRQVLGLEPAADSDGEDPEEALRSSKNSPDQMLDMPIDYRCTVIRQIIYMCSKDTYSNISDFEWYIEILLELIKLAPIATLRSDSSLNKVDMHDFGGSTDDLFSSVGNELRNVSVRVTSVRQEVVQVCDNLLKSYRGKGAGVFGTGILHYAAWVVGEYVSSCDDPFKTLDSLLLPKPSTLPLDGICAYLQAVPKVFSNIVSQKIITWDSERKTSISLLISRIVDFLEPLSTHPSLEVQERCVEFLELFRVASQALADKDQSADDTPLLLTRAIPDLFTGQELNSVAPTAQRKVPLPDGLDLDSPINAQLQLILHDAEREPYTNPGSTEFHSFYNDRQAPKAVAGPAIDSVPSFEISESYQRASGQPALSEQLARRRTERREKNKDDPFYIGDEASSGTSTPFHEILRASNGDVLDVDSIPIMSLDLGEKVAARTQADAGKSKRPRGRPRRAHVAKDETFGPDQELQQHSGNVSSTSRGPTPQPARERGKRTLLEVDSSNLGSISLTASDRGKEHQEAQSRTTQNDEMAKALAEVERLRLEMQRASERIHASDGAPAEGTLVKKKKKKKARPVDSGDAVPTDPEPVREAPLVSGDVKAVKKKKKKKKARPAIGLDAAGNDDDEMRYQE